MRSRIIELAILAVAFAGLCVYAFPGYLSFDSVVQIREARSGIYTDWHPPAMAVLWHQLEHVVRGPALMFVLQVTSFLVGTHLVLRRFVSGPSAAILTLALAWFPPVATSLGVIWKDSQMLGFLMLGTALVLGERRGTRLAGLVVLGLASAMRHNAFTITFAIVILAFVWSRDHARWRRYAIATAAWVAITVGAHLANVRLADTETHPWHGSLALFDIGGTMRFAPPMTDDELRPIFAGAPLLVEHDIYDKFHVSYSPVGGVFRLVDGHVFRQPTTEAERDAIARAWKTLIFDHPRAYLVHRWRAFRELLALPPDLHQWVWVGVDNVGVDIEDNDNGPLRTELQELALWFGTTWLFRPYFYLLLLVALLPFCIRKRQTLATAFALSAILSELALFCLSPTPDFRYSLWLVPSAFLVTTILVATGIRRRDVQNA